MIWGDKLNEKVSGNIIIGGAEDKEGDKEILKRVAKYIAPPIIIKLPLTFSFNLSPQITYFLFYPIQ